MNIDDLILETMLAEDIDGTDLGVASVLQGGTLQFQYAKYKNLLKIRKELIDEKKDTYEIDKRIKEIRKEMTRLKYERAKQLKVGRIRRKQEKALARYESVEFDGLYGDVLTEEDQMVEAQRKATEHITNTILQYPRTSILIIGTQIANLAYITKLLKDKKQANMRKGMSTKEIDKELKNAYQLMIKLNKMKQNQSK